jgi:hypothetical protein
MVELMHETAVQPSIALIGGLVDEIKISTNKLGAGASGRHMTQFL